MTDNRIYLSPPHMSNNEKELLIKAFDSNWIAPLGPCLDQFEKNMSNYLGGYHTAALSSGTAALHLALRIIGVNEGDRIICPSLTFAATANCILYEKAYPVFIDSKKENGLMNLELLESSIKKYKPKALITVDLYGYSSDYDVILEICNKYNVIIIEDSAEALGSEYKNKKCGTFGTLGVFSFNGNKIITTSGGGMLVSENQKYIEKAKFLSTQAKEDQIHYEHKELGYNYRMSNLLASIGIGQLMQLDTYILKRKSIFKRYKNSLSHIDGFIFPDEVPFGNSNYWLTTVFINHQKEKIDRNKIINALEKENIESRPIWKPMHLQPLYKSADYITQDNNDVSAQLFNEGLCLPSGSNLLKKEQDKIIDIILSQVK
ncbi:aminotransferase class I/II-fold pyridoxal phosphate-dependent enzyme [Candidatus Marinimicrobia bacterium]|nr:aminotransferase class I/II-fold pyridoxal phosphate-dependent enzyme [Candidatus Neomarinimicrobiota bacterium]